MLCAYVRACACRRANTGQIITVFGVAITEAQVDLLTGQIQVLYMYACECTCAVHMYVRVRVDGPIRAK